MFLQIEIPAESFPAYFARERFLLVMRVHVKSQIVHLVKGFRAHGALVRFLRAVSQFVVLVISLLVKAFPAQLADERLVPGVYPRVRVQRRTPVEGFPTGETLVRFLRGVYYLVPAQRRRLPESFPAYFAYEGTGSRVHGHVSRQVVVCVEHFTALRTHKVFLFSVVHEFTLRRTPFPVRQIRYKPRTQFAVTLRPVQGLLRRQRRGQNSLRTAAVEERILVEHVAGTNHARNVFLEGRIYVECICRHGRGAFGSLLSWTQLHDFLY